MKKMLVLQSGFVSPEHPGLIRPDLNENDTTFQSFILDKGYLNDPNIFFFERGLNGLFAEYTKDFDKGSKWDFKEQCIKSIVRALGTYSFMEWIEYQLDSPHITEVHSKFLKDTLQFLRTGKRDISVETWYSVVTIKSVTNKKRGSLDGISKNFSTLPSSECMELCLYQNQNSRLFNTSYSDITVLPVAVRDLITIWLGRAGGFHDLMMFAGTVFSKRDQIYSLG